MPRARLALFAAIAAALILPTVVLAQSGTPGTDNAADGVYGGGDVLGPPEENPDNPGQGDGDDPGQGNVAGPGDPGSSSVPFAASDGGSSDEGGDSSVPFTGFYALLAIAVAFGLMAVGAGVRRLGRDKPPPAA
jgi:hypothetical protein